jgi:hypothetical protein
LEKVQASPILGELVDQLVETLEAKVRRLCQNPAAVLKKLGVQIGLLHPLLPHCN